MTNDQEQAPRRGRGRPTGTVKPPADRLRDRVRTVTTLSELLLRTGRVNNVNQFASWFDSAMRRRYPGRAWETATNNKWRKNFSGGAALTADSIDWLGELFPDVASLFDCGPGRLWKALFEPAVSPDDLWSLYEAGDTEWGNGSYDVALEALQIRVFCSFDFNGPLGEEDLGRAIVLRRLNEQFGMGTSDDGVELYLCVKAALADVGIKYGDIGVFHEIADHLAGQERRRVEADWVYRKAIKQRWAGSRRFGESGVWEYVENPFPRMAECAPNPHLAGRWWSLAALTHDNYRRSEVAARKPIKVS